MHELSERIVQRELQGLLQDAPRSVCNVHWRMGRLHDFAYKSMRNNRIHVYSDGGSISAVPGVFQLPELGYEDNVPL
jgi:arylamine N-acetyltransferase